jgi:head-tail adaptor
LFTNAAKARKRLQVEAIKLNRAIRQGQERLSEIDEEESVHAAAIEEHGGKVAAAHAEPAEEPSEAEVSGSHP